MPRTTLWAELDASADEVFAVVHDYDIRLHWDAMLSDARLVGGATQAGKGVRSVCTGTWHSGYIAMETEYIQFEPGRVAAVELTNRVPLFSRFAASIRHRDLGGGRSSVTYTYSFRARPRLLAAVLEPIMNAMLRREVRGRLQALARYLRARRLPP